MQSTLAGDYCPPLSLITALDINNTKPVCWQGGWTPPLLIHIRKKPRRNGKKHLTSLFLVTFRHGCACSFSGSLTFPKSCPKHIEVLRKFHMASPYFSCPGISMWLSGGTEHHGRVSTEYLWEQFYWPVSSTRYWKTRCTTFKSWCFTLWGLSPELCCPQWKGEETQR